MRSKFSGSDFLSQGNPLAVSAGVHAFLLAALLLTVFPFSKSSREKIDFEVFSNPTLAQRPIALQAKPKSLEKEESKPRAVFGSSRKAVTSEAGQEVKAGNTVAKDPDQEKLQPTDADSLPIPADEYLVSKMPVLVGEIRVPYTPEAKRNGIQGAVILEILVDSTGSVREVKLVEGPGYGLNEAAAEALKKFRFKPAEVEGKAVAVRIRYAYRFVLER